LFCKETKRDGEKNNSVLQQVRKGRGEVSGEAEIIKKEKGKVR
jgi:hypothetical protein